MGAFYSASASIDQLVGHLAEWINWPTGGNSSFARLHQKGLYGIYIKSYGHTQSFLWQCLHALVIRRDLNLNSITMKFML